MTPEIVTLQGNQGTLNLVGFHFPQAGPLVGFSLERVVWPKNNLELRISDVFLWAAESITTTSTNEGHEMYLEALDLSISYISVSIPKEMVNQPWKL